MEKSARRTKFFVYVISGALDAQVGKKKQKVGRATSFTCRAGRLSLGRPEGGAVRYAAVRSTPRLEAAIRKHGAADNWRG